MATIIWIALGITWGWNTIALFRTVDPAELPRRTRQQLGCLDADEPLTVGPRLRVVPPRCA
jgi:hypothetical protein